MNEKTMLETLRDIDFLRGVAEEDLEQLVPLGQIVDFPEGKTIFREYEPASHCLLIVEGSVALEICAPAVGCTQILTVGDGELLGWASILGHSLLTATGRTLTATRVIELSGPELVALCEQNPDFGYEFMRRTALTLGKRLTATRLRLLDMLRTDMPTVGEQNA